LLVQEKANLLFPFLLKLAIQLLIIASSYIAASQETEIRKKKIQTFGESSIPTTMIKQPSWTLLAAFMSCQQVFINLLPT
jgi:hypothetical protein